MAEKTKKTGKRKHKREQDGTSGAQATGHVGGDMGDIVAKLAAAAASPAGRQVIAAGLSMAAAAAQAAVAADRNRAATKPADAPKPGSANAAAPDALAAMIGGVAETFLGRVFPPKRG